MTTQPWRRALYGDNPPSAAARDRAALADIRALALEEVEKATAQLREAELQHQAAMEYAASTRCSLRQIGEAADLTWSVVSRRLKQGVPHATSRGKRHEQSQ